MGSLHYVVQFLRMEQAEGKAASTLRNHYRALKGLDAWLGSLGLADSDVRPLDLADYVCCLRERHPADQVNIVISAARVYFRWLAEMQARPDNPAAGLRFLRVETKPVESLTTEEVRRLLSFAGHTGGLRFGTDRTAVLTACLIDTGMRLGEALRLRLRDLDLIQGRLHVTATKTGTTRSVPLSPILRRLMVAYLRRRAAHLQQRNLADCGVLFIGEHGGPWTIANAERSCKTVARLAGVMREVYPHLFRHTFATLLLAGGAPLFAVMLWGGWKKVGTVRRYSHMSPQQQADVHAATSPLMQASRLQFVIPDEEKGGAGIRSCAGRQRRGRLEKVA